MEVPETRYVERPDGVSIAYQVFGAGPPVLWSPGFISHLDLQWTEPRFSEFMRWLGGLARVAIYDKPGTGLSDPIPHVPTLEERSDDIVHVMNAAGMERATLMGFSEGTSSSIMVAVTQPERVERLVLYGGIINGDPPDDELLLHGLTREELERRWSRIEATVADWGRGRTVELLCPSVQGAVDRQFWALFERASASPKMARGLIEAVRRMDVGPLLTSVQAPTLVVHNVDDFAPVTNARVMADRIPNARLVELPGGDHAFWLSDPRPVMAVLEEFLTGTRRPVESDRVLATVLFTDVVGSTQRASQLGDASWRAELEQLEEAVRAEATRHRGRVVKSLGDGHLCVFDGPARAIHCALTLTDSSRVPLRAGVHTGECEAMGEDVGGLAVHIGARVAALAGAGEVLVSGTVKDLVVGAGFSFADRGEHELKGVPGRWRLHAVGDAAKPPPVEVDRRLRAGDKLALRMANRAPGRMRSAARLALKLNR